MITALVIVVTLWALVLPTISWKELWEDVQLSTRFWAFAVLSTVVNACCIVWWAILVIGSGR